MFVHKLIIVGSGPAAYTAAIYAARADLAPVVFESSVESGGALMLTTEVENFPGFPEGIMGPDLMDRMRAQAERFGAVLLSEDVTGLKLTPELKGVRSGSGEVWKSSALVLATGSAHRRLNVAREDELSGRGVSYCATCDGSFFRDQDIVVVGGGDTAAEEALFLTKFGSSVTMLVRSNELRASKIMQDRILAHPLIKLRWSVEVDELVGEPQLSGVKLRGEGAEANEVLPAGGLFIAIGHDPRSHLVKDYLPLNDAAYVIREQTSPHGASATTIPGVFVAGDVADHRYRQAITAAGSGAQAAIDAEKWLEEMELD